MKFICDKCKTKYSIADEKVHRKVLKIRCKNCGNVIIVRDPKRAQESGARRSGGGKALERALDGVFSDHGSRRALRPLQAPHIPALAHRDSAELRPEPEEAPTVISPQDLRPPETLADDEWYLAVDGHQFGPMSFAELCSRVRRGEARSDVGDESYVWRDGFDDWVDVGSVPELRPYVPPPPPPKRGSGVFPLRPPTTPLPGGMPPPPEEMVSASVRASVPSVSGVSSIPELPSDAVIEHQSALFPVIPPVPEQAAPPSYEPRYDAAPAPGPVLASVPAPAPAAPASAKTPVVLWITALFALVSAAIGGVLIYQFVIKPTAPTAGDVAKTGTDAPEVVAGKDDNREDEGSEGGNGGGDNNFDFPPVDVRLSPGKSGSAKHHKDVLAKKNTPNHADGDKSGKNKIKDFWRTNDTATEPDFGEVTRKKRRRVQGREITSAEVQQLLIQHKRQIQGCYNRALKRDYSIKDSRADVTLLIGASGKIKGVSLRGAASPTLGTCLKNTFRRWVFRPLGGTEESKVNFPLLFRGG